MALRTSNTAVKNHISFDSNIMAQFLVNYRRIAFLQLRRYATRRVFKNSM